MNGPASPRPFSRPIVAVCFVLVVFAWLVGPSPVRASRPLASAAVVSVSFADDDGWSVRKLLGKMNNRTRIIQIAVGCMCLGLFILMRKLSI